ncbi:MAG TPA: AmmeMemoRadiSam system radical SAM enzyme [Deltaproteobacteria bacterium]|nr:MAG: AmmeMemoRadiSam system radical SAM enzyme [Deltaproteobacteria bacterium GWA2_55_82]OGQ65037.1 MAG: AmmeMemoRadiSam system radical SAM enzyme [Deltaproteobacteria bacterium RIFCSPLOWO2_02_FULL_55_12]OIJ73773.1 MAG: AmmeMemoRadiSam system radical SAM enzyme [Deltaproteobacteria bacterium GWC2_55_46]HBG45827.1 AmmeMemoRadiSam system radical SAM enzyme [Deltaproteobacteria bacterium]HCY09754.1 AmmeMemoRadiSam system radical SAM enzyme [Deltaproteobacteria bacterium]
MREARLYSKAEGEIVNCVLCAFRCRIKDGHRGVCGVRENIGGVLYTHTWGCLVAEQIDPIEKKPLYHFQPSSRSFSIATAGCNFRCLHCQNSEISQMPRDEKQILGEETTPEEIVAEAYETGCSSISYTYTEPTIFFEFAQDICVLASGKGLKNVFVTNGYMTKECLDEMNGILDAANVDVKSFSDSFYKKVCGARLAPVLESIERMRKIGVWVEITTLLIPGMNDSDEELKEIARWIFKTDKSMPWHISAFHPAYKMTDIPPTPLSTLERARAIGLDEGLRYVYTGNIPNHKGESTWCYRCGALLIERRGFVVSKNDIADSKCPKCGSIIDGVDL